MCFICMNTDHFFVVPKLEKNIVKRETETENCEMKLNCRDTINSAPLFDFSTNLLRRQID